MCIVPPPTKGLYYIDDIEGLEVATLDGEPLGQVREVLRTGANDVWIVDRGDQPDLLIPALRDIVRKVDLSAGMITVDLPEGLTPNTSDRLNQSDRPLYAEPPAQAEPGQTAWGYSSVGRAHRSQR